MSRVYYIHDARGERELSEADLPLAVGGSNGGDVVIAGVDDDSVLAYIALSEGHAYIQPADGSDGLYHNHERVTESRWLKSGDQVQLGVARDGLADRAAHLASGSDDSDADRHGAGA